MKCFSLVSLHKEQTYHNEMEDSNNSHKWTKILIFPLNLSGYKGETLLELQLRTLGNHAWAGKKPTGHGSLKWGC